MIVNKNLIASDSCAAVVQACGIEVKLQSVQSVCNRFNVICQTALFIFAWIDRQADSYRAAEQWTDGSTDLQHRQTEEQTECAVWSARTRAAVDCSQKNLRGNLTIR